MIAKFIGEMAAFIAANPELVALVMGTVEYLKTLLTNVEWFKGEVVTVSAFIIGFLFALPVSLSDIVLFDLLAQGIALGGLASGLYKLGDSLLAKR